MGSRLFAFLYTLLAVAVDSAYGLVDCDADGLVETTPAHDTVDAVCGAEKQCTCSNGTGTTGKSCPVNGLTRCVPGSCSIGYHMSSANDCVPNLCSCSGGTAATGAACTTHAAEICANCTDGYFMKESTCLLHKTCGSHEFISVAGSTTNDVECRPLTTCKSGEYVEVAATATSDQRCAEKVCHCVGGVTAVGEGCPVHGTAQCTSCFPGFRLESRVNDADVKQCLMNSCTCTHGSAATGALCTQNGSETCSDCGVEKHMDGKVCRPNTPCDLSSNFISTEATETSDRVCEPFKVCTHTQFMVTAHTKYTDTVCQEHRTCDDGEFEEFPGTPTQDATCTAHRVCDAGEFESVVPWKLADRECEPCPVGHYCVNMKKHACLPNTFQPKTKQSSCESCESIDALRSYGTAGKLGQTACTPVPLDCKAEKWGEWSTCSLTCGSGLRSRRRLTETQLPCNLPVSQLCSMEWGGGKGCSHLVLEQNEACNTEPCPIDCVDGEWSSWGTCSATCGGGMSTRKRKVIKTALHGGKACGPTVGLVPCNVHACDYKPRCNAEHVGCTVAEVRTGLGESTARVMRVTHHRANMHIAANYHCSMINGFRECSCVCDKQPECCEHKNRILTNAVLQGNLFTDIADSKACCDMCNVHPDCTSWQFVHARSDTQIPGTCVLKGGSPSYLANPDLAMTTWAGVRAGLTGAKCQPPKYTVAAVTTTPPPGVSDLSQFAGVPVTHAGGVN